MVMLERWSVLWRESGRYGGHQFKGRRWSCYRGCHFNGGRKVIRGSEVVSLMEGK